MSRRPQNWYQERLVIAYDHAQVTATTAVKLWNVPAGRKFRVDRILYVNPTGLAADAANFYALTVDKDDGPATIGTWSTETGEEGALTADTFVELTLSATDADLVLAAGDELSLTLTETGTQTLPAGRVVIEGRLI